MTSEQLPDALTLIDRSDAKDYDRWMATRAFVVGPNNPYPCAADIFDRAHQKRPYSDADKRRLWLISEVLPRPTETSPIGRVACMNGCQGLLLNPDGTTDYSQCLKRNHAQDQSHVQMPEQTEDEDPESSTEF